MKKIVVTIFVLLLLPTIVGAVADALTFDADTNIEINDLTFVVQSGSLADQMVVNPTNVQFTLSANSSVTIISSDKKTLTNTLGLSTACGTDSSSVTLPGQTTETVVTVTPSTESCGGSGPVSTPTPSGGGGGGGTPVPVTPPVSTPVTSTGEVTATADGGGKTTLTTDEETTAAADLPADAVSASTDIKIVTEAKETAIASRPVPSGRSIVGGYAYNYTATANGATVSSFGKAVTLTFTYTDEQISGLNESNLRVFYWKEETSQWVALTTTVNAETNTLTAETTHFTYFAIMGLAEGVEEEEELVEEEPETAEVTIVDGDLVRNSNAVGMAQFDIYIVKLVGSKKFKRLIISPHVFESYEHFDKNANGSPWDDVLDVDQTTMDAYTTSDLVRAVGDPKVYRLSTEEGADTGIKQWLNMTVSEFEAAGYDWDSIYEINTTDRDAYTISTEITG